MSDARDDRITKQDLKRLPALVAAKNLSEIKLIINTLKPKSQYRWSMGKRQYILTL
jgi:hypothetical protein